MGVFCKSIWINCSLYSEFSIHPKPDKFLDWEGIIFGPESSPYQGGIFKFEMKFPKEYPNKPPKLQFITPLFHPNIYTNGKVCISILHEGVDQFNYESVADRWKPIHGITSILMSIVLMLAEPNLESPANVDASKMYRDNYEKFIDFFGKNSSVIDCTFSEDENLHE